MNPIHTVGSPLTSNATKVLVLGGGDIGRELTISFQRLGMEVHVVDSSPNVPAHQVAQFAHIADIRDPDQVTALMNRVRPDVVVPEGETAGATVLAEIEDTTDIMVVPTARACDLSVGKEAIRTIASDELGLPTTAYRFCSTRQEYEAAFAELGYPCVVKPEASTGGRGHSVVRGPEDIDAAWEHAHRNGDVVVERFVDFDYEFTLLTVRSIDPATGELATWFGEPIGTRHEDGQLREAWQPLPMSELARDNARSVAARITNELGGRGVYGVEMFVAQDEVYFSSVSPHPVDAGMLTLATQRFSQFDLHARAVLGLPIDVTLTSPGASVFITAPGASRAVSYQGLAEAMAIPESDVKLFSKTTSFPGRRMGMATATAETVEVARQRAAEAAAKIIVSTP